MQHKLYLEQGLGEFPDGRGLALPRFPSQPPVDLTLLHPSLLGQLGAQSAVRLRMRSRKIQRAIQVRPTRIPIPQSLPLGFDSQVLESASRRPHNQGQAVFGNTLFVRHDAQVDRDRAQSGAFVEHTTRARIYYTRGVSRSARHRTGARIEYRT